MKSSKVTTVIVNTFFIIFTLSVVIPFLMIVVTSISNEDDILIHGYTLIPRRIDFTAWKLLLQDGKTIFGALLFTLAYAVIQPALHCIVCSITGYALSRNRFVFKGIINKFFICSMFFSGGMIPTYIITTQWYKLGNNPALYYVTGLFAVWNMVLFRTFFQQIPKELIEAAEVDGATQSQVLVKILLPMSKSIFGMIYFQGVIAAWNNWSTSLIYFTDDRYWTLQYILQRIIKNTEYIKQAFESVGLGNQSGIPTTVLSFAMCCLSLIPLLLLFPYVQKYFAKGMAAGSVKG